jgi:hypothetical protein
MVFLSVPLDDHFLVLDALGFPGPHILITEPDISCGPFFCLHNALLSGRQTGLVSKRLYPILARKSTYLLLQRTFGAMPEVLLNEFVYLHIKPFPRCIAGPGDYDVCGLADFALCCRGLTLVHSEPFQ